jgi:ribosomal protein S18 acetylase RimI-like enzyme
LFTDAHISIATKADTAALLLLLNSAYRGETSQKGWTSEAHLIDGNIRCDEKSLLETFDKAGSVVLTYINDGDEMIGCVNLQKQDNEMYLGMFAVNPLQQGMGIGKKLLQAAEAYAFSVDCYAIYMTVISLRTELIDWYKRYGYVDTGEKKPFTEDAISGKHLQQLEFVVLKKQLQRKK